MCARRRKRQFYVARQFTRGHYIVENNSAHLNNSTESSFAQKLQLFKLRDKTGNLPLLQARTERSIEDVTPGDN